MVAIYSGDLNHYYAKMLFVDGAILSDEFEIKKPWINLQFDGEKFEGILSLIVVDEEGNRREVRNTPPAALQGEGWLNSGWFAFDVKGIMGCKAYFQVNGVRALDAFNLKRFEQADQGRGPESLDWYACKMMELMKRDETVANSDPFRPVLHTAIPSGKSWDANGLVYKDGWYHFFYLARPNGSSPIMGHKVSRDLVHWEERPPACLASFEKGENAIWSGSVIIGPDGRCHIFYTSVGPDRPTACNPHQGHDVSIDAEFTRFEKVDPNMIVTDRDIPFPVQQVRDPCVFKREGTYYMTITGGKLRGEYERDTSRLFRWDHKKQIPVLLLFESDDLYEWTYRGIAYQEENKTGFFEVSDLFGQDGRWFFSPGGIDYYVGDFDFEAGKFTPSKKGTANAGLFYAYRSMQAPDGRRLAIGRIKGGGDLQTKKWTECYSWVREWWLEDDVLHQRPARENQLLRGEYREFHGRVDGTRTVFNAETEFELITEIDAGSSSKCGLHVRCSDDGSRFFQIGWDVRRREAWASVVEAGEVATCKASWMARLTVKPENKKEATKIKFQVIVDRGLVQVFVDDEKVINRWVEDIPLDCTGIAVFAEGGEAVVSRMDYWSLGNFQR